MRIIPAIDLIEGKCVRLYKGDYATQKVYNARPIDVAKEIADWGLEYLHLVDLDGAKLKKVVHYNVLEKIAGQTNLKVDFSGGIQSDEDIRIAFESGATQIAIGSIAVKQPNLFQKWLAQYGSEKIILSADVNVEKIVIHGWQTDSQKDVFLFIQNYQREGLQYVACTDVNKDGTLTEPAFGLYEKILEECTQDEKILCLIASGGIASTDHLTKLKGLGCEGAIIGKAIYECKISLKELSDWLTIHHK